MILSTTSTGTEAPFLFATIASGSHRHKVEIIGAF